MIKYFRTDLRNISAKDMELGFVNLELNKFIHREDVRLNRPVEHVVVNGDLIVIVDYTIREGGAC